MRMRATHMPCRLVRVVFVSFSSQAGQRCSVRGIVVSSYLMAQVMYRPVSCDAVYNLSSHRTRQDDTAPDRTADDARRHPTAWRCETRRHCSAAYARAHAAWYMALSCAMRCDVVCVTSSRAHMVSDIAPHRIVHGMRRQDETVHCTGRRDDTTHHRIAYDIRQDEMQCGVACRVYKRLVMA